MNNVQPNLERFPELVVRAANPVPVIMIGHGSSGTSILGELLRDYLQVAFGTESQFIIDYYQRLDQYGDLSHEANRARLVDHLLQERWFQRSAKFGFSTTREAILADVQQPTYRGILDAVFGQIQKHFGYQRWGDKTPIYNHHLDVLYELFPEAKYIHMIRDGRDVALSVMNRYWGPKNIFTAAHEWKEEIALIDEFIPRLPANQILEIKYEELLGTPIETFMRIYDYLEIDDPTGAVRDNIVNHLEGDLNRGNFDKWKRSWTRDMQLAYERIACVQLRDHGYETILEEPAAAPSAMTSVRWKLHNRLLKLTYLDYWKDNVYKAKLRCRRFSQSFS